MKSFYKLVFLSVLLILPMYASAQFDLTTALRKYWKTRGRLVGDEYNRNRYNGFLVVGDQPGMSIPAEQRGKNKYGREIRVHRDIKGDYMPGAECGKQNQNTSNPPIDPRDGQVESGQITWGDGTIQLAHYLIALGYEHALMRRAGDPEIWRTERELYYALKALKRLDIWGESYIPSYSINGPHENGFFVRDDVPKDFALRHMGAEYDIVKSDRSCGGVPDYNNELSYDQYVAVMLGLRMVYHLVPYHVSYNNERLIDIVRDISKKASDRVLNMPLGIIFQPSNNMFDNSGLTVHRGNYVPYAAYPMAVCAREIAGSPNGSYSATVYPQTSIQWFSKHIYETLKTGLALDQAPNYVVTARQLSPSGFVLIRTARLVFGREASFDNHNDNANMMIQSMVASRKAGVFWDPTLWNPWLAWTRYVDLSGAKTVKNISSRYKKAVYQLYGSTLCGWPYGDKGDYDFWESEFNKYPCCGPCVYETQYDSREVDNEGCVNVEYTPTGTPPRSPGSLAGDPDWAIAHPWTTTNRWEHWGRDHKPVVFREYAGVDFLESFGAYLYKMRSGVGVHQNLRVNLFTDLPRTVIRPIGSYTYGNVPNPFYGRAVFSMQVKGTYAGEVDGPDLRARAALRAGSNIDFIPGFYAQGGSLLDAQIAPFDCEPQPKIFGGPADFNAMLRSAGDEEGGDGDTAMMEDNWLEYITGGYDTSAVPFEDSVFMPAIDTVREQFEDSTLIRKYMNAEQDTMYIELDSCWAFNDSNELVNICDPQNRPLSTQALALKSLKIYPTPARNELFLEINTPSSGSLVIGIFDMMGRNVTEACTEPMRTLTGGEQVLKINTHALPTGNYSLRLILGDVQDIRKFTIFK